VTDECAARFVARRATLADVDEVVRLLHAASRHLAEQGYANWTPPYPPERVAADVVSREVYLVYAAAGGAASGTFTLGTDAARPYDPAPWPDPSAPALYLNRLAVHPGVEGRGLGGWCLDEIARIARARGSVVRCDVIARNRRLRGLYERHGYLLHGERSHSGWTFASYEWAGRGTAAGRVNGG
jgi:ribosomal protein S18 acetylase RimI-like enzyme